MTQEEVNSIAKEYAEDKYCRTDGNLMPKYKIAQIHAGRDGFVAGTEWRINSVWHNWEYGNNVPDVGELCLVEFETDVDSKYYQRVVHADKFKGYNFTGRPYFWNTPKDAHIIRWAYVKDLLPSKEK